VITHIFMHYRITLEYMYLLITNTCFFHLTYIKYYLLMFKINRSYQ